MDETSIDELLTPHAIQLRYEPNMIMTELQKMPEGKARNIMMSYLDVEKTSIKKAFEKKAVIKPDPKAAVSAEEINPNLKSAKSSEAESRAAEIFTTVESSDSSPIKETSLILCSSASLEHEKE
jgi:hypothetical protein